ncbi:hypothetical protein [Priestia megaterium]|uniref:Uncharacterized protein n=1 Tax=Priestia megaterium TaxID=1404 RepID=A0A6M6EBH9_PRIMG|nr:hypothetical protein [Priestia megaterium]QJX80875.1 hypothetical protein FDZ14_32820 [Priestia megaterium]
MTTINIKGLDKRKVLQALYDSAQPLGMGFLHYTPEPLTLDQAENALAENLYKFDYLKGRVLKVNIIGDTFDSWLYDRDNGEGAAEQAINKIR